MLDILIATFVVTGLVSLLAFSALVFAMSTKRHAENPMLPRLAKATFATTVLFGLASGAFTIISIESGNDALVNAIEGKYGVDVPTDVADRHDLHALNPWTIDDRDYLCRVLGPADIEELFTADPVLECVAADEVVEFAR